MQDIIRFNDVDITSTAAFLECHSPPREKRMLNKTWGLTINSFTSTWPTIGGVYQKKASFLSMSSIFLLRCFPATSYTSKAPRTRYHPQRLPWWWPVQSSPGEHLPHPEGARQCQHLAVLVKSWGETAGNLDPNDWIVFVNPCWALALVGASAVPAATPCGKNLSCNWNATKKCMDEKIEKEISPKLQAKIDRKTYWNLDQCV